MAILTSSQLHPWVHCHQKIIYTHIMMDSVDSKACQCAQKREYSRIYLSLWVLLPLTITGETLFLRKEQIKFIGLMLKKSWLGRRVVWIELCQCELALCSLDSIAGCVSLSTLRPAALGILRPPGSRRSLLPDGPHPQDWSLMTHPLIIGAPL